MGTPITNFGKVTVSTGYDAVATAIALSTGHGSRLPSTFSFPLTWWDASTYSDAADDPNREIVKVTARTGDTLTVVRAHESTTASVKNVAGKTYKMVLGITKAMWDGLSTKSLSQSFRGLSVQTHPDADKAASQVLFSASAIVLDDGEEVRDWTNIAVDLAASGVNGLDTGAEAASTWYELWAIYDGTNKKGVLHRAKDYFLDESWDQSGGTTEDGQHLLRDATARTKLAQGFKVDTAGLCEFVDVKLVKAGAPTGVYWFTLESNSGGVPSGTVLATSDKYDVSRLTTTATWVRLPFRTPASLSAATQYHLVLQGNFTVSGTNHMAWRADTTAATYANGSKAAYDGTTWTADTDDDFLFQLYITRNEVALTLPSGYTQSAKIGYVHNNGSSNLKPCAARDRCVSVAGPEWKIGSQSSAVSVLTSLAGLMPPVPCSVAVANANNTGAGNRGAAGHITEILGDPSTVDHVRGTGFYPATAFVVSPTSPAHWLLLEYQGMTIWADGATNHFWVRGFEW
jgi:hypothetical protein